MSHSASDLVGAAELDRMLHPVVGPAVAGLAAALRTIPGLAAAERATVHDATAALLRRVVWRHVSRVVVLELHLARLGGDLTAGTSQERWQEWAARLSRPGAWQTLAAPYPALLPRLQAVVANRCTAAHTMARRFAADRATLSGLLGGETGELREVRFGAGDSHQGGQTVTVLGCAGGQLVYKPRSVGADGALGRLLPRLLPDQPAVTRIRVPAVHPRADRQGEYGWAEYVPHRYCDGDGELRAFYRGLGHWLAVMRLLRGSDLHSENVVACGPVPVVVDCETLFTPHHTARASGYGAAVDLATDRVSQSVLRTGMLPGRGRMLGWRGVDPSAAGNLPGQQPSVQVPTIVNHGTDQARVGTVLVEPQPGANLPTPDPDPGRYWELAVDGFTTLTEELHAMDRSGALAPMLQEFADTPVRVVLRDTVAYGALARMLWHPRSLGQPADAARTAAEVLARQADNLPGAPHDPAVIDAEIADLCDGDVPVFVTVPRSGMLTGPRGTRWGAAGDLVTAAVTRWREADLDTDRHVVRSALAAAYLNDGSPALPPPTAGPVRVGDLERRRRTLLAAIMQRTVETAVRGDDGTATWVAPVRDRSGFAVRPMGPDLYSGLTGVAVVLAGYAHEVTAGRAEPVPELAALLGEVLRTLRMGEAQQAKHRAEMAAAGIRARPEPPGGYLGLGSRIVGWLLLHRLGAIETGEAAQWAEADASLIPEALAADESYDLLGGMAGAVVPLLQLAGQTGRQRWAQLARDIGHRLGTLATRSEDGACWPNAVSPDGLGGVAHGVTGIGWALARLADAGTGLTPAEVAEFRALADAAFCWEDSLYDPGKGTWWDARAVGWGDPPRSWCNGAVGIGICAADLLPRDGTAAWGTVLERAVRASWPAAFGANHTLCHGDAGAWELLARARLAGVGLGPSDPAPEAVQASVLTGVEDYGPLAGVRREMFHPGLFLGAGGVAYQLLRMHPDCDLPSVLLPDPW